MPGSITFFPATANDEVARKSQPNMMGTRQPPPVAPRTTSITLQTWQQSTTGVDNNDGNDRYARSASTDSLESSGSSSSGSGSTNQRITDVTPVEYIPTRTVGKAPKLPSHNPLQFVKVQSPLYKKAEQQIKLTKEVKITREALKEGEEEWQSNLDNWKSRRRKASEKVIQRAEEMRQIEAEEQLRQEQLLQQQKKIKKFSEIVEKKATRSYNLELYIGQGDDSGLGGTPEPDDTLDCHSSHLRSDTSEGMTSEAESVDSDIHKSDKILEKEPPKVPQKPYSRFKKSSSVSYDDNQESSNELFHHRLSRQNLSISDNISSTEPSDVEGHAADTEATSSEEDITFSGQTGNIDSGLESFGDNQRGNLADSASDLSQGSSNSSSSEKNHEKSDLDLIPDRTENAKAAIFNDEKTGYGKEIDDNQTADLQKQSFKICIKPGDNRGFGFTLKGGKDLGCLAYIDNVLKDGPADEIGIKDGDEIISINGEPTADSSHASLLFSVKQAAYTGILDLVISRGIVNNDLKLRESRKRKTFAEKLAIFSAAVNVMSTTTEESKSNVKVETKRESLVLRRRSAFENGKADNLNAVNRRSSCASHTMNASSEKSLEKRHSIDLTLPQNVSHENNQSKKGPPPPVPVKPKIKSKPMFLDANKPISNKLNGNHENTSSLTQSTLKARVNESTKSNNVLPNSSLDSNTVNNKQNLSDLEGKLTDEGQHSDELGKQSLFNKSITEETNFLLQASDSISLEDQISVNNQSQIIDNGVNFDAVENEFSEICLINLEPNKKQDISHIENPLNEKGFKRLNETGDLSPVENEIGDTKIADILIENSDDFESEIQACTNEVFINDTISANKTNPLESIAQTASECAIDTTNETVTDNYLRDEILKDTDEDTNSSDVTSACYSKCDKEKNRSHTLECKDLEIEDESEITESKNSNPTNPSPLCLSLEKIDEDDVISASTTTSSDTPDTETVIETLPSNLSPLPNDESNGEDSSKLLITHQEESEQHLEATDVNELSSNETNDMIGTNYLEKDTTDLNNEPETVENLLEPYSDSVSESVHDTMIDKALYDDQQDDEYARELDESFDQITSLDIIDRIEQSLMDQLQQETVYEDIDNNFNSPLESDGNNPWLYFSQESELLDDLTPRNLEPPHEPPPPPPPPETENNDNKVSISRTNSTKRIKKEIWRRRSDFLGLDSPEAIDVDSIPPPPVGLEELLKQEREQTQWLEKQLSLADPQVDISPYSTESGCLDSGNYSSNDYSEYFVEESADVCKDAAVNSQSEKWKENVEEDTPFGVQYESPPEQFNPAIEDNSMKTTESPQHKAKQNIQSLGAAPKAKIMDSTKWITEKVGTVNKKSIEPVFRQSSYNQNYWLAQDGERRRNLQYLDGHADSMPPVYSYTHPDVTVRTWGDREYEYQQHRPKSAIYERSGNMYNQYMNMDKKDLQRTQSLDSQREMNFDTDTLESEVHKCSCCGKGLCEGSAMGIEALRLYFHIECFRCCLCQIQLGNGSCGTDVQVKNNQLYCPACFTVD